MMGTLWHEANRNDYVNGGTGIHKEYWGLSGVQGFRVWRDGLIQETQT